MRTSRRSSSFAIVAMAGESVWFCDMSVLGAWTACLPGLASFLAFELSVMVLSQGRIIGVRFEVAGKGVKSVYG